MEEEPAPAAAEAPCPEPPITIAPMKVRGGKIFEFCEDGLHITTKSWLSSPKVDVISWDGFKQCDVTASCFSGMVTLTHKSGNVFALKVRAKSLQAVAKAIVKFMNKGKEGAVDPGLAKKLGKRPPVEILGGGVMMRRKSSMCSSVSTFVPWEHVVSVDLVPGCLKTTVTLVTILKEEHSVGLVHEEEHPAKAAKPAEPEPEQQHQEGQQKAVAHEEAPAPEEHAQIVTMAIKGRLATMEAVFKLATGLLSGGQEAEPVENAPEIKDASFDTLGLETTKGKRRQFLPWRSVASVRLVKSLLGGGVLAITDTCGRQTLLRRVAPEDFDKLSELCLKEGGGGGAAEQVDPIVKGKVKITSLGVYHTKKKLCSSETLFLPWSKVDAAEMDLHCCGGKLFVITEVGERIPIRSSSCFGCGLKGMAEVARQIREMKYGRLDANGRTFGGREGDPRACVLTDTCLRLVTRTGTCSSAVRVLDLDAVARCEAPAPRRLLVHVKEDMGIDGDDVEPGVQPLEVKLRRGEDAADIVADVMRRMSLRKRVHCDAR